MEKTPRVECKAFLAFVRTKNCCRCWAHPQSQAAHIRTGSPAHGKRQTGFGEKPSDRWAVPLCAACHLDDPDFVHRTGNEAEFWRRAGVDPFVLAEKLWAEFEKLYPRAAAAKPKRAKRKMAKKSRPRPKQKIQSRPFPKGRKLNQRGVKSHEA